MSKNITALTMGILFAIGLGISGMTQPQKVIGFLDLFGQWDPSLAFVMIGAIGVHASMYRWIRKRSSPVLADQFHVPNRSDLTPPLLVGAALFGVGWGVAGFCPGPGLTSLASGNLASLVFVGGMVGGMLVFKISEPLRNKVFPKS